VGDVDPFVFTLDILIAEIAYFPDTETGRIHESDHSFHFDIRNGVNEISGFFLGRDIREISVKLPHGDLSRVPGFMKDIHGEETDLGNGMIDRTVRETTGFFKIIDKNPDIIISNLRRILMEGIRDIIKVNSNIGAIRLHGMIGQTAKRDHFFITF